MVQSTIILIVYTPLLFFVAAIAEIGGGYLVWEWIRKKKSILLGLIGGVILFLYAVIPTLQPASFGRVYAAYGGVFILSSIVWGALIDKKKPDKYEIIGSLIVILGSAIIYYSPR